MWQGNVDALLQLGDSHWYGRGAERDWARAAQLYQTASKYRNAQALFNLGFMHEFGAGLPQARLPTHTNTLQNIAQQPLVTSKWHLEACDQLIQMQALPSLCSAHLLDVTA